MWTQILGWLQSALPITAWLPDLPREGVRDDAVAGVTVGVMVIPQGMAYAVIAGMPPIYGLYAALVPLLVYPLFGSSRHLALGPTAIDMLLVAGGLSGLAQAGTPRYIALAVMLAGMVGVVQLAMGAMKFGFVANLLSRPVIVGLTTAAAFIISFSQIGALLGIDLGRSQSVHVLLWQAAQRLGEVHVPSLLIGTASIAVLVLLPRFLPNVPGALAVAVVATVGGWAFDAGGAGVDVVGQVPEGLPGASVPLPGLGDAQALLPTALTLALVQFLNVVTLGRTFAKQHGYTVDPNRELVAVGAANLAGSIFSSIPASGSFSRSAVNDRAGARSPLANVFAAGVIALTLLFLTPLFANLPMPALAAIIMVSGFGLIDLAELRDLFMARRRDGAIALFTAACVLFVGIQEGILLGIGATVIAVLYRISRPNVAELGHVPGTRIFRDLERFGQAKRLDGIMVLRVDAAFSFANARYFKDFILEKSEAEGRDIDVVVVDGTSINALDTTAVEALSSTVEALEKQGIELHLTSLIGPVRETIRRSGLHERMGADRFHLNPHEAVAQILGRWDDADDEDGDRRRDAYLDATRPDKKEPTPVAS
jgi:SulP family sulfate permease